MIDIFLIIFKEDENVSGTAEFTALKSTVINTQLALNNAQTGLEAAEDSVKRAELAASGGVTSASDAQVKQALGSLLSAQANLAKTILRSPVSGTINSLDVRVGDYVANQQVVAKVANNNALEVITYVGDEEISAFSVGSTVLVEDDYEGIVTAIAPAVDSVTRKTEVRIALETNDIKNGDTVRVSKVLTSEATDDETVTIPLTAVKFEIDDGYIFIVEDEKLVSKPVELGVVRGGSVEVVAGLSPTDQFVTDARGLVADTKVEVRNR